MVFRPNGIITALCAAATFLVGCATQPDSSVLNDEVVVTQYNKATNFGGFTTFAVNPTVSVITDSSTDGSNTDDTSSSLPAQSAAPLLTAVVQGMTAAGFTQVNSDQQPDIGIDLVVLQASYTYWDANYWWGWGWAGYPGYWGYPGYAYWGPWVTYSSYRTGTLIVQAFDLKAPRGAEPPPAADANAPPQTIPLIWTAGVYGVLSQTTSTNIQTGVAGINQAFEQSPYFTR